MVFRRDAETKGTGLGDAVLFLLLGFCFFPEEVPAADFFFREVFRVADVLVPTDTFLLFNFLFDLVPRVDGVLRAGTSVCTRLSRVIFVIPPFACPFLFASSFNRLRCNLFISLKTEDRRGDAVTLLVLVKPTRIR